jgi:hypothetical protein
MSLDAFEALIGDWTIEIDWPGQAEPIRGATSFAWLEGGGYVVQRSTTEHPKFPNGISVIGPSADDPDRIVQHYFDSRGVARIYDISLEDGVLRIWRDDDPGFAQRYAGRLSADGRTITSTWENCRDGVTWEHDFAGTHTKVG